MNSYLTTTATYLQQPLSDNPVLFHHKKLTFSDKNSDIFHISAQNIDCAYKSARQF